MNYLQLAVREQHRSEISHLESVLVASQCLLRAQADKYAEQIARLASADAAVRQLAAHNDTLVAAIEALERAIDDQEDDSGNGSSRECLEAVRNAIGDGAEKQIDVLE